MAKIETTKSLILADQAAGAMQLSVGPAVVSLAVHNDGTSHVARLDPSEATQLGVALIQLAAQAAALDAQRRVQVASNGMPHLG